MATPNPAQGYEIGIFNQLVRNSEAIALTQFKVEESGKKINEIDDRLKTVEAQVNKIPEIETRLTNVETRLTNIEEIGEKILKILNIIKWLSVTIGVGVLINIISTPVVSRFYP